MKNKFDVVVAGELIEHLSDTLSFFNSFKKNYSGKTLLCTTPNATSVTNFFMSLFKRESCHKDHLQVYSYKTLNTLCIRAGFKQWEIIPYKVKYTELIARSPLFLKLLIIITEKIVNFFEYFFPLTSGGLILNVKKI